MKKRVFLATGVAVLSAAVLAACSSGNGNKEATKPVTFAQKLYNPESQDLMKIHRHK